MRSRARNSASRSSLAVSRRGRRSVGMQAGARWAMARAWRITGRRSIGSHHGDHRALMQADKPAEKSELTEFCWTRRDDGIHFVCEELPPKERIEFVGARYLHAIYAPSSQSITHFDGALRIY